MAEAAAPAAEGAGEGEGEREKKAVPEEALSAYTAAVLKALFSAEITKQIEMDRYVCEELTPTLTCRCHSSLHVGDRST